MNAHSPQPRDRPARRGDAPFRPGSGAPASAGRGADGRSPGTASGSRPLVGKVHAPYSKAVLAPRRRGRWLTVGVPSVLGGRRPRQLPAARRQQPDRRGRAPRAPGRRGWSRLRGRRGHGTAAAQPRTAVGPAEPGRRRDPCGHPRDAREDREGLPLAAASPPPDAAPGPARWCGRSCTARRRC